ncbi:MAG: T9SS type A sorting domain-containing protein [Bacteroidota bacterium]
MALSSLFFFGFSSHSWAQPSISISPEIEEVDVGETFSIDIVSTDFNDIVSCQFSLVWNADLIEYDTFNSELPQIIFFNELNANEGKFAFVWTEGLSNPLDFDDGTIVMRLFFKGLTDGISPLDFVNSPTQMLAIYESEPGTLVETPFSSFENGTITVGNPNSIIGEQDNLSIQVLQNSPNPFSEHSFIPFTLNRSEFVSLDIFDINGIKIYQYSKQYGAGSHAIRIEKEVFPEVGTYLYQVSTSNTLVTKKMILVR